MTSDDQPVENTAVKSDSFQFELLHQDAGSSARLGKIQTTRGVIDTPAFMPVGTQATVKGLTTDQVKLAGSQVILGNTYHLSLRPGEEVIQELGGLHRFMDWSLPILTDSGGFQIFSLASLAKVTERGVQFRSHIDGSLIDLTPERSIEIQKRLGSDIAMVLDHVPSLPATDNVIEETCMRTIRWASRCRDTEVADGQALFGIVQGGLNQQWRQKCATELRDMEFDGYAVGGLSVGESPEEMYETVAATCPFLPTDRPRYLMGVGRPEDLLENIARGIDMFDCVMPTRNGRNALAFTDQGPIRLRNLVHRTDDRPLDEKTQTPYSHLSRGYLRHLFLAGEMLGPILLSLHNIAYYQRLMREARQAISEDRFTDFCAEKHAGWGNTSGE